MKIDYLVEADSPTQMLLFLLLRDSCTWEQNIIGYHDKGVFCGDYPTRPNMLSLNYILIDDKVVCFYWGCSQEVDHKEIDIYLKENYPDITNIEADTLFYEFNKKDLS